MMQEELTDEQMHKLENVLYISFHGVKLQEECTSLVTSQSHWDKILRLFIASKRLENCSQGTIDRYVDCVTKLVNYLNKRFEDITTNDIRYYLAMYQETRHVSISYMDSIRRYFSSFFGWLSDEGFVGKNPMRRIKHMKVPQRIKKPFSSAEREHLRCNAECQRDVELRISSDVYDPVRYGIVYAFYISGVLSCLVWKCCRSHVDECVPDYLYSGILHGKEDGTH